MVIMLAIFFGALIIGAIAGIIWLYLRTWKVNKPIKTDVETIEGFSVPGSAVVPILEVTEEENDEVHVVLALFLRRSYLSPLMKSRLRRRRRERRVLLFLIQLRLPELEVSSSVRHVVPEMLALRRSSLPRVA